MTFDRESSAGYLANHMARLFAQGLRQRIAPLGLEPAQFMVLLVLWREDGLTQKELVERLDVEQATMANTLSRMARAGLIERHPHPTDARAKLVSATTKARALEKPATAAASAQIEDALTDLSPDERRTLLDLMRRVIARMRET